MKKVVTNIFKIIVLVLMLAILLIPSSSSTKSADNYYIDYRKSNIPFDKGLVLYGENEAKMQWTIEQKTNTSSEDFLYDADGNISAKRYFFTREQSYGGRITILYPRVGRYIDENGNGREVSCRVYYSNFQIYDRPEIGDKNHPIYFRIEENFYKGFFYSNIEFLNTKYVFFYSDDSAQAPIPIKNTFFTMNSLTWNEGAAYITRNNAPAYLNEDYIGTRGYDPSRPGYGVIENSDSNETNTLYTQRINGYTYFFGRAIARNQPLIYNAKRIEVDDPKYVWFDDWIGKYGKEQIYSRDYEKGSVSFLLNDTNDNYTQFDFVFTTKYKYDNHAASVRHSMSQLGTSEKKPKKSVNKSTVNPGDEIEYTITQKLHTLGIDIINNYLNFKIEDKLPNEVEYISSIISSDQIGDIASQMPPSYNGATHTVICEANSNFLNSLELKGQTITLKIKCRVKTNQSQNAQTKFGNTSTTYMNYYTRGNQEYNKFSSDTAYAQILPTFSKSITKTGTDIMYDVGQQINYSIKYTGTIGYYIGNKATVQIVDTLPYEIDTSKSYNLNGGTYNARNKTITWNTTISNINSFKNQNNSINITKNISLVFKDVNPKGTSITNIARGITSTEDEPKANSGTAQASKVTNLNLKMNIIAKKTWDDQGKGRSRRPSDLYFVLYSNGKPTNKTYKLNPQTKDTEEYIFTDLEKYDKGGNRINYEVREISKQSGSNYYRLQDIKGNVVENRNDLKYYIDSTTTEEESAQQGGKTKTYKLKNSYTSINLNGNVWLESQIDGKKNNGEAVFKGMTVQLILQNNDNYEYYGYSTRTDANGNYSFKDIPWNGKYKIRFVYNGQIYEATYYKDNLNGTYSNAKEYSDERDRLNKVFENITAYPNNYGENKRAFGINEKIKNVNSNDFCYDSSGNPYTFESAVLAEFNNMETTYQDYTDAFYNGLRTKLINKGIDSSTANSIIIYLKDCMTYADTKSYSADISSLKNGTNNNIGIVSFAVSPRVRSNLTIRNDVYKVTYTINGKQLDEYESYNKKPSNVYNVSDRARNEYYNGILLYSKPIYKSDYLFDGEENRKLQIYVTYKTIITNNGNVSATVKSLNNYYDTQNYEKYDETKELKICKDNTKLGSFVAQDTNETLKRYTKLILTANNPIIIHPGETTDVDITFKIKTENNRVKISDVKKDIVEINSYATYYTPQDNIAIPDTLGNNDTKINKQIKSTTVAGLVDVDSDPGSLRDQDLTQEGNLKFNEIRNGITFQRMENDTDKAPDFRIVFSEGPGRSISGFAFEDNRNIIDNSKKTSLGNGKYDNGESKINGVTVELVELVREIDKDGLQTENYIGEHIWGKRVYQEGLEDVIEENEKDYYTGKGTSKVIITGADGTELEVAETALGESPEEYSGKYQFDSIVPGDYYVRFTYGDTNRTVLLTEQAAKNRANEIGQTESVNEIVQDNGMNNKSYNGQDYKATLFQPSVNQESLNEYNGIKGFVDYDNQNFTNSIDDNNKYKENNDEFVRNNKKNMFVYVNTAGESNAKDLYGDREKNIDYGKTVINNNGEVLQSFEKLASNDKENKKATQNEMLEQLKQNTQMRAQTGVINIGVVHNNNNTNQASLGLVERAKSQVTLKKEVTSISVVLQNGKVLFNTDKSINNLYFGAHSGHGATYDGYRLTSVSINRDGSNEQPELLQAYIDDELMAGAIMTSTYKLTAKNIGEVDFNDKEFYYTGVERDPNRNITKSSVNRVVDYITNTVTFDSKKQKESDSWKVVEASELVDNNLVTAKYRSIMDTYDTLLVTEGLNGQELVPELYNNAASEASVSLVIESGLANVMTKDAMVYNNIAEVIQISNSQGRRGAMSIPGNEEIVDQTLISNAKPGESVLDRRTPIEVDADSSQKIVFMPPTGGDENYTPLIFISIIAAGVIAGGALIIKKLVLNQ